MLHMWYIIHGWKLKYYGTLIIEMPCIFIKSNSMGNGRNSDKISDSVSI